MSERPKFSTELHILCGKLRDDELTPAESRRLNEMLLQSKEARRYYRTFMALASALETRTTLQESVDQESEADKNIDDLFGLIEQEEQAEVIPFPEVSRQWSPKPERSAQPAMTMRKVGDAASYLIVHAVKSNQAKWLAAAAVVLIGVTLVIVLNVGNNDNAPTTVESPGNDLPTTAAPSVVATLTAEHDAVWERRPGVDLYAKQRFTLIQGFAEITTVSGALAILEAPATIELTDNDNALHLHNGKLIGICETESSKGFLVRTPHMDITDIGTRFGVDVLTGQHTHVQVMQGDVQASSRYLGGQKAESISLSAGQAAQADPEGEVNLVAFQDGLFQTDTQLVHLRPGIAKGRTIWGGQARGDFRLNQRESKQIQLYIEHENHRLDEAVVVDAVAGQRLDKKTSSTQQHVAAGTRVDVYLLHADALGDAEGRQEIVIEFDRPVLGVISDEATLRVTDVSLGVPGVQYPDLRGFEKAQRGLDLNLQDGISLSRDGRTLRIFSDVHLYLDQVRILVQSNNHEDR